MAMKGSRLTHPAADLEGMTFCYYGKVMTGDQKGNLTPTASSPALSLPRCSQN